MRSCSTTITAVVLLPVICNPLGIWPDFVGGADNVGSSGSSLRRRARRRCSMPADIKFFGDSTRDSSESQRHGSGPQSSSRGRWVWQPSRKAAAEMRQPFLPEAPRPSHDQVLRALLMETPETPRQPVEVPSLGVSNETDREILLSFQRRLRRYADSGDWSKAFGVLQAMTRSGFALDSAALSDAIRACAVAKNAGQSMRLLARICNENLPLDMRTYEQAISACLRSRSYSWASQLLDNLRDFFFPKLWGSQSLEPSFVSTVLEACRDTSKWQVALELLQDAEAQNITLEPRTWLYALSACERAQAWRPLLSVLRMSMPQASVSPCAAAYGAAIRSCSNCGQLVMAKKLLEESLGRDRHPRDVRSYAALLEACEQGGRMEAQWELSIWILETMQDRRIALDEFALAAADRVLEATHLPPSQRTPRWSPMPRMPRRPVRVDPSRIDWGLELESPSSLLTELPERSDDTFFADSGD